MRTAGVRSAKARPKVDVVIGSVDGVPCMTAEEARARGYGYPGMDSKVHIHVVDPTAGRKDDAGKADWTLLPWDGLEAVRRVLEFGAKKYSPDNWRHVPDSTLRYTKAALRHTFTAITQPGSVDEETGESHWAHAVCCGLFILGRRTKP